MEGYSCVSLVLNVPHWGLRRRGQKEKQSSIFSRRINIDNNSSLFPPQVTWINEQ